MTDRSFVSPELRARIRLVAVPIALGLGKLGLTPNALTIVGFLGTCVAALAAAAQAWVLAGVLVIVFGIFDLFDGALARATGQATLSHDEIAAARDDEIGKQILEAAQLDAQGEHKPHIARRGRLCVGAFRRRLMAG